MRDALYLKSSGAVKGPFSFNSVLGMHNASRLPSDTLISDRKEGPFLPFYKSPILDSLALAAPQWYWRTPLHSVGPITGGELRQHLATNNSQIDGEVFHSFFTGGQWIPYVDCHIYDPPNSGDKSLPGQVWSKDALTSTRSLDTDDQGLKERLESDRVEQLLRNAQVAVKKDLKLARARDNAIRLNTFAWIAGFVVLAGLVVTGIYFGGRHVVDKMRDTNVGKSVVRQSGSQFSVASHEKVKYKQLIEALEAREPVTYQENLETANNYLKLLLRIEERESPPENIKELNVSRPSNLDSGLRMLSYNMKLLLKNKILDVDHDIGWQRLRSVELDSALKEQNQIMLLLYTKYYLEKCNVKEGDIKKVQSHNDELNELLDKAEESLNKLATQIGGSTYKRDVGEDMLRLFNDYIGLRVAQNPTPTTGDSVDDHSMNCARLTKQLLENQLE